MVYGGTIRAGHAATARSSTSSPRSSATASSSPASIDEGQRSAIVRHSCPGAGACGGMYTANTMASAIEALGHVACPTARRRRPKIRSKSEECVRAGEAVRKLLELDLKPRDIMTRQAFENAMVLVTVLGGSTNAVLHLIAMARAVGCGADDRRLSDGERPHAVARRLQAERQVRDGRPARRRRHAGRDEDAAREGLHRRQLHDRHRQDHRRESRRSAGLEGRPADRPAL